MKLVYNELDNGPIRSGIRIYSRPDAGNPSDWRIGDVKTLCAAFELELDSPPGGSHYGVKDPSQRNRITVPFRRPIKTVYIRELVRYVDAVRAAREEQT